MAGFTIQNGKLLAPNGQPFTAHGIDIYLPDLSSAVSNSSCLPLLSFFPGLTFIRLCCSLSDAPQTIQQAVAWATAKGIVIEIEYHLWPQQIQDDSSVNNFYARMAAAFAGNPYVWYGTENEPAGSGATAISTMMLNQYNAIRNAGATSPIMLCPYGGGNNAQGMAQSVIQGMVNVMWDLHFYNWISGYSTDLATNQKALANEISMFQSFANLPVLIGEYGNSTDGANIDQGWQQAVQAVQTNSTVSCTAAFAWNPGGNADWLFTNNDPNQGLSAFGKMAAQFIASAATTPVQPPTVPPPSQPPSQPSPSGTVITPGSGVITDSNGNAYTLAANGTAMENSQPIPGGGGTAQMQYLNGQVLGQDATSKQWYAWNGTAWVATQAPGSGNPTPPPAPPPSPPPAGGASPSGTKITPGSGTITDGAGNAFTLGADGTAYENGKAIPGGGGTSALAYVNGHILGQDASTQKWYRWSGKAWVQVAAPKS